MHVAQIGVLALACKESITTYMRGNANSDTEFDVTKDKPAGGELGRPSDLDGSQDGLTLEQKFG